MNNVELRWVTERISSSHKSMTLQYRLRVYGGDHGHQWTEWMTVPTVDEEVKDE
jgi:hypothetical protein